MFLGGDAWGRPQTSFAAQSGGTTKTRIMCVPKFHLRSLRGHRSSPEFPEESSCVHDVPQNRSVSLTFGSGFLGEASVWKVEKRFAMALAGLVQAPIPRAANRSLARFSHSIEKRRANLIRPGSQVDE